MSTWTGDAYAEFVNLDCNPGRLEPRERRGMEFGSARELLPQIHVDRVRTGPGEHDTIDEDLHVALRIFVGVPARIRRSAARD